MQKNIAPKILLRHGGYFDYSDLASNEYRIEDIASALSMQCRYGGHVLHFYSVAQHSVYVSYLVERELSLEALMHDASEAYMPDMMTPLKVMFPEYKKLEHKVQREVNKQFGLPLEENPAVKYADLQAVIIEREVIQPWDSEPWTMLEGIAPPNLPMRTPMRPSEARDYFLNRYAELTGS